MLTPTCSATSANSGSLAIDSRISFTSAWWASRLRWSCSENPFTVSSIPAMRRSSDCTRRSTAGSSRICTRRWSLAFEWFRNGNSVNCTAWLAGLVDKLPVTHLHNRHDQEILGHLVKDSVRTLPNPVSLLPGKLFAADRAGILQQFLYSLKNTSNIVVWN